MIFLAGRDRLDRVVDRLSLGLQTSRGGPSADEIIVSRPPRHPATRSGHRVDALNRDEPVASNPLAAFTHYENSVFFFLRI